MKNGLVSKYFAIPANVKQEFEMICGRLGMTRRQGEIVTGLLQEWNRANAEQARITNYFPGSTSIQITAGTVNLAIFQKAEVLLAKEELTRILDSFNEAAPDFVASFQLDLARALKKVKPIYNGSRDPELIALIQRAEAAIT